MDVVLNTVIFSNFQADVGFIVKNNRNGNTLSRLSKFPNKPALNTLVLD